jgi:membrane-bound serine protease (ClpP class)
VVFLLGLALVVVEMFVYPGTVAIGLAGAALMFVALIMAMVDIYPGMPKVPSLPQLRLPLQNLLLAFAGGAVAVAILSRFLPKTPIYRVLVSQSVSGVQTEIAQEKLRANFQGRIGSAVSVLRPGGKAQFGDQIIDVMSQGDMIAKGTKVKIVGYSGSEAIVEAVE